MAETVSFSSEKLENKISYRPTYIVRAMETKARGVCVVIQIAISMRGSENEKVVREYSNKSEALADTSEFI